MSAPKKTSGEVHQGVASLGGTFHPDVPMPPGLEADELEAAVRGSVDFLREHTAFLRDRGVETLLTPTNTSTAFSAVLEQQIADHSAVLVKNRAHNGSPDLIPKGLYPRDAVLNGNRGLDAKANSRQGNRGQVTFDSHGARKGWYVLGKLYLDKREDLPPIGREPTRVMGIYVAKLSLNDFRSNGRSSYISTRTASPNASGLSKLRAGVFYSDFDR